MREAGGRAVKKEVDDVGDVVEVAGEAVVAGDREDRRVLLPVGRTVLCADDLRRRAHRRGARRDGC